MTRVRNTFGAYAFSGINNPSKSYVPETNDPANGYEYVDLGLPSGNLWATCNIGASSPEEYGKFFQWADVTGHEEGNNAVTSGYVYKISTAPYSNGSTYTKYTTSGDTLELADDAAHVLMGGDWIMPSKDDLQELIDNTTVEANVELNGVKGHKFTSKTDTSVYMFVPYAGYCYESDRYDAGGGALLWSNELGNSTDVLGCSLDSGGGRDVDYYYRCSGQSVRGVLRNN